MEIYEVFKLICIVQTIGKVLFNDYKSTKVFRNDKRFLEFFLRNVEIIVLAEAYGANYAKANWAKWAKAYYPDRLSYWLPHVTSLYVTLLPLQGVSPTL